MPFILTKLSAPGWEKEFGTKEATRLELSRYICVLCRKVEHVTDDSSIEDMLSTACGCEFDVTEGN